MRVALVVAGPYPALRGSQVLVQHLARGLGDRGHRVHLVTYGRRLADRPGPCVARLGFDLALVARLWRMVRHARIDVIHAHNYEAAIAGLAVARVTSRPLVYHGHCALEEELPTYASGRSGRSVLRRLGRFLDTQVPRRADFCVAVTEELGAALRRAGVTAADLACIPPAGAPHELRSPATSGAADGAGLVCYAGNLDGYQNLEFLLRSFGRVRRRMSRARLVLVTHEGGRAEAARLGRLGLGAGVEVVCARSFEDVRERLATADVTVCPRSERSGFPMKLLNYMAAGKAIVAAAGSAKGLRDGITARVVADGDEEAFAEAVADLLVDAPMRARLGAAARRAVENDAAWESVLDRIEAIYRHVVSRARPHLVPVPAVEQPAVEQV
jgi:1,2-diacylglycerol 3-alpha-glucosyltransferase